MKCRCGAGSRVINVRGLNMMPALRCETVMRTRECPACKAKWQTIEVLATQAALEKAYQAINRKRRSV